jgi:hypothetical protein
MDSPCRAAALAAEPETPDVDDAKLPHNDWASPDELPPTTGTYVPERPIMGRRSSSVQLATAKPRTGRTTLAPGKTARHVLDGETAAGFYHEVQASKDQTPNTSSLAVNQTQQAPIVDRRVSAVKIEGGSRLTANSLAGLGTSPNRPSSPTAPISPRKQSTYGRPDRRLSTAPSFTPAPASANGRDMAFAGERSGASWVG